MQRVLLSPLQPQGRIAEQVAVGKASQKGRFRNELRVGEGRLQTLK